MGTISDHGEKEKLPSKREKLVINELIQGKECANRLRILLLEEKSRRVIGEDDDGFGVAEELLIKTLKSFDESLLALGAASGSSCGSKGASDVGDHDFHQRSMVIQENSCNNVLYDSVNNYSSDDRRPEDSGESKNKRPRPSTKDKRGCYKRKKNLQTWSKISSNIEDNHAWRKYGQKEILNAKYPRSYFRCTRKYDQGCRATKQVQRIDDDDEELYEITYIATHTCKDTINTPQMITTSSDNSIGPWGSYLMGGTSRTTTTATIPKVKEEGCIKEESTPLSLSSDHDLVLDENSLNLDSGIWQDLLPFESSSSNYYGHSDSMISFRCSDYGDFESRFHFDESDQYFSF